MPWELHIQRHEGDCDPDDPEWALGSLAEVNSLIESYFPDIDWENANRGVCTYDDGVIEFDLSGDPVGVVWLRVHSADPALTLIAMARAMKWHIINDSTGDDLKDEEEKDEKELIRIQKIAKLRKGNAKSTQSKSATRMPRIKLRIPLNAVEPDWILTELQLVCLRENEVTFDVFEEYCNATRKDDYIHSLKGHPVCGQKEVVLNDGRRFAAMLMSRNVAAPEVNVFFDTFWQQSARTTGKVVNDFVVLNDGSKFATKDCTWVERARGRTRVE